MDNVGVIKHVAMQNMPMTYYEILIDVECEHDFLYAILMQIIADSIAECGDGIEFIDGTVITLDNQVVDGRLE